MKLIIKRSEWLRGVGYGKSWLLNNEGKRCCLGILGRELGFADEELLNYAIPYHTKNRAKWFDWLMPGTRANSIYSQIIYANDSLELGKDDRENKIKELFLIKGIEVEYED